MNQRPKLLAYAAVAIAIAYCGVAIAADQEKDAGDKARMSTRTSSSTAPSADTGKANTMGPGARDDIPLKDRKIVAPDDFALKDQKIVAPNDIALKKRKSGAPDKTSPAIAPDESSKKPILAVPTTAPSTTAATTAIK